MLDDAHAGWAPPSFTPGTERAVDLYLDLTLKRAGKVKGESRATGHEDDIAVHGFSWGVGAGGDAVAGPPSGRRSYKHLVLHKPLDAASTALMSAVAFNDEVRSARLCLRKAGGEAQDYCSITLEQARVVSLDLGSDAAGQPVEQLRLSYQRIGVEYRVQQPGGELGASTTFTDDLG